MLKAYLPMDNQTLTKEDQQALNQASMLVAFQESEVYQHLLKPFLVELLQEGWPNPKDYSNKPQPTESLLLDYTRKIGEADAIKKVVAYIENQHTVIENLKRKQDTKEAFTI